MNETSRTYLEGPIPIRLGVAGSAYILSILVRPFMRSSTTPATVGICSLPVADGWARRLLSP